MNENIWLYIGVAVLFVIIGTVITFNLILANPFIQIWFTLFGIFLAIIVIVEIWKILAR
ncbi:MAG: hypothetical protein HQ521_06080 [Bacteroidetes bacterium]|nr:hypothetical protein [Bacteroidota bacterium]